MKYFPSQSRTFSHENITRKILLSKSQCVCVFFFYFFLFWKDFAFLYINNIESLTIILLYNCFFFFSQTEWWIVSTANVVHNHHAPSMWCVWSAAILLKFYYANNRRVLLPLFGCASNFWLRRKVSRVTSTPTSMMKGRINFFLIS